MNRPVNNIKTRHGIFKVILLPAAAITLLASCGTIANGAKHEQSSAGPVATVRGKLVILEDSYFETENGVIYDLRLVNKEDQQLLAKMANSPPTPDMKCFNLTVIGVSAPKKRPEDRPSFVASHIDKIEKTGCPLR